jgi:hypothetical protein
MITHVRSVVAAVVANVAARAPTTFDPNMTTTATLPTPLLPHRADALALPVTVAPNIAAAVPLPATLDPQKAGSRCRHHDNARRRRFFFDLDVRDRCAYLTMGANHAAGSERERRDQRRATESILH